MAHSTALLVIDPQVAILDGAHQAAANIVSIQRLIAQAHAAGALVIYMQHDGDPGESLEPGTSGWQIHADLTPRDGDLVLRKRASDSFYSTPLEDQLRLRDITRLVIAGLRTERCVDTTSRQAVSMGYDVTLVGDAHTTKDSGVLTAAQIIAHTNDNLDDFGNNEHVVMVLPSDAVTF